MTIYFYSKTCENCSGNHALASMKGYCKKKGVDFQEKRTILWSKWEKEAEAIIEVNEGLELPFFYNDENGKVLSGYSGTPLMELEKLIKEK